jgi:SAM-dependent methyltransferase
MKPLGSMSHLNIDELDEVYKHRFSKENQSQKELIWKEICHFLQKEIPATGNVLELATDLGYFINNIEAKEKWATDIRDVSSGLALNVKFVKGDGLSIDRQLPNSHFDTIFMSNYLEHLPSTYSVIQQLNVCKNLLKTGGRVIILQPNIRLIGSAYWDFIDHSVALTDKSLQEAVDLAGLKTHLVIKRFLPFTTKSRIPQSSFLVKLYLKFPPVWFFMGKQTLFIAEK